MTLEAGIFTETEDPYREAMISSRPADTGQKQYTCCIYDRNHYMVLQDTRWRSLTTTILFMYHRSRTFELDEMVGTSLLPTRL